ncbi:biotin/lipoyl-containing protein [Fundicoccus culcitae]|uniref:Acetyl-CoA carboxylase biotin carboxyl carrier protein subunit n=1 Tax=Fundicoccus culcitae TaxID=2969821 RepID=A0ABY5P3B3_9LACT|nr:biotin/lipoyl-containing protein [Fundicoccus culcitae]UUX33202.1 acetyl-CoA carboxylase biotin carboxyl carrier protein subunit [Fundicoccus culcitae]
MLRKFKIKIDGQEYLVEMEEIGGTPQKAITPATDQTIPIAQAPASAPTQPEAQPTPVVQEASVAAGEDALTAPMPGTILQVFVEVGQQVQENEKILILEAMKMENEIVATKSGVIVGIYVSKGSTVEPGAPLVTIK